MSFEILKLGNPILRQTAKELTKEEILSSEIQELIPKMWDVMKKLVELACCTSNRNIYPVSSYKIGKRIRKIR